MRGAIAISVIFHMVVYATSGWGLPYFRSDEPKPLTIIPVEILTIDDVTRLKRQQTKPQKTAKKKPPPKRQAEPDLPPAPPKLSSSMPLPDMKPKPQKTAKQVAVRSPTVTPRRKPAAPSKFNSSKISALLNKHLEKEKSLEDQLKEKGYDQLAVLSDIDLKMQTSSIADAIRKQIYDNRCWSVPAGVKDGQNLTVTLSIDLKSDGSLSTPPMVREKGRMTRAGEEAFRTVAESAIRAVRKCAPYKLPREKYEIWRSFDMEFDLKAILNG